MSPARTSEDLRTHNRVRLLRAVHDKAATLTRAQLTELLGMARGTASVLVAELAEADLLTEHPTEHAGRGRPSLVPGPHPRGPVALTVHLREDGWELAAGELGGGTTTLGEFEPGGDSPEILTQIAARLADCHRRYGHRLVGAGVSIAGPVRDGRMVHASTPTWHQVDARRWLQPEGVPVHLANDATLAALAEARRGKLRDIDFALHLHVDFGVGGCLVDKGQPLTGAHGLAGEFGHMRLTRCDRRCECGAVGCWGQQVGVMPMLREYGVSGGYRDGRRQARRLLESATAGDRRALAALHRNVEALGGGVGGLVNAHDPRLITVSGLGATFLDSAPEKLHDAYVDSLMRYHRADPPRLVAADLGPRGPLLGAMELVFDAFLTPAALATWERNHPTFAATGKP